MGKITNRDFEDNFKTKIDNKLSEYINAKDYEVTGDGVTSDYVSIQLLFTNIDNYSHLYFPEGDYIVDLDQLLISGKSSFKIIFHPKAKFYYANTANSTSGTISCIKLLNCTDFNIENPNVNIVTQNQEYSGLLITNSKRGKIINGLVDNARWNGYTVYDSILNTSEDIEFIDCVAEHCRAGLFSNGKRTKIIRGNYSNDWLNTDEAIAKNNIWSEPSLYFNGIEITGEDWIVDNVNASNNGQEGILLLNGSKNGKITNGSTITNNQGNGISLCLDGIKDVDNYIRSTIINSCTVKDNKLKNIYLNNTDDNIISSNQLQNDDLNINKSNIALVNNSTNNIISNNTLKTSDDVDCITTNLVDFGFGISENNIFSNNKFNSTLRHNEGTEDYNTII
jgi:hypothetical protein